MLALRGISKKTKLFVFPEEAPPLGTKTKLFVLVFLILGRLYISLGRLATSLNRSFSFEEHVTFLQREIKIRAMFAVFFEMRISYFRNSSFSSKKRDRFRVL